MLRLARVVNFWIDVNSTFLGFATTVYIEDAIPACSLTPRVTTTLDVSGDWVAAADNGLSATSF